MKKIFNRHDTELGDVREELAKNSDYFTFYVNNSNTDDLSAQIKEMKEVLSRYETTAKEREKRQEEKHEEISLEMTKFSENMEHFGAQHQKIESSVSRMREELFK